MISNAVCHRSYLSPGKIQVALFDDRLEVTSPGMLDSEITIEKMKSGLSKIRNRGIATAFSYMNIVEAWGSGIPKMFREAKEYGLREPELIDMGSDFRINLYRKDAITDRNGVIDPKNFGAKVNIDGTKVDTNGTKVGTKVGTNGTKVGTNGTKVGTNEVNYECELDDNDKIILQVIKGDPNITQKEICKKNRYFSEDN